MNHIFLVEDDEILGNGIRHFLERNGYNVTLKTNFEEGINFVSDKWDIAILDENLPDGSGIDICKKIREKGNRPVIFLTANDTALDMVTGFENGCDDYISKPFDNIVLLKRISAVLRRSSVETLVKEKEVFKYEELEVDFDRMQVSVFGENIKLSVTEYKILELLIRNKGQVITRDVILDRIWDRDENYVDENTLNVHIRRLRKKIEVDDKNPKYIITVFGIGYTFGA